MKATLLSMSIAEFLSEVKGFDGIQWEDLLSLADQAHLNTYAPGRELMRAGEPGDTMHVIRTGMVKVPILDESGEERMVFHLGPGELVGEMALLTGELRSADVIAEQQTQTVSFDRATLQPLLEDYPNLARFLTEILGRRLEEKGGIGNVGKYKLIGKLGEGATGKVYEALHPTLNRTVAMKMLSHSLVYNAKFRERFLGEARLMASLSHPNIVQIFDTESAYATYFIVMEKLSGKNVAHLMKEKGKLDPYQTASILRQMAAALSYAHSKGFAHRDVKPANAALDARGTVKLMDFGLARPIAVEQGGMSTQSVDGTPQYIAPETAMGKVTDGRVDIYALGVMGFEMLTGRLPFEHQSVMDMLKAHVRQDPPDVRTINPDIPGPLADFVNSALIKDPQKRLSDYDRIQRLLDLSPRVTAGWVDETQQALFLRFRPSAAARVAGAVERFAKEFADDPDVQIAFGDLAAMSTGADSEGEDS